MRRQRQHQHQQELRHDEKERAEHIMLVDLGRNDVGRVAESGTVKVESLMNVERYSHVMHISSTVTGTHPWSPNPSTIRAVGTNV